jgi:hypothetical protein
MEVFERAVQRLRDELRLKQRPDEPKHEDRPKQ